MAKNKEKRIIQYSACNICSTVHRPTDFQMRPDTTNKVQLQVIENILIRKQSYKDLDNRACHNSPSMESQADISFISIIMRHLTSATRTPNVAPTPIQNGRLTVSHFFNSQLLGTAVRAGRRTRHDSNARTIWRGAT